MASHGRAAAKPKGAVPAHGREASGTFRVGARDETGILAAVEQLTARSAGRPLDDGTRAEMEALFAHDFGAILVHTDEAAAEAAEVLDAEAFTIGDDLYFAEGAYRPGDESGEALIAHELAHVVQRDGAFAGGEATRVSEEDDAVEQEAEAIAREALRGDGGDPQDVAGAIDAASRAIARRATHPSKDGKHKKGKKGEKEKAKIAKGPKEPSLPLGRMPIVERLAGIVLGNFAKDADDKSGRIRRQLARLGEKTRKEVLETIDARLNDADKRRFTALMAMEPPPGTEVSTPAASEAETTDAEQREGKKDEEKKESALHEGGADAKENGDGDAKAEADAHADAMGDGDAKADAHADDASAEGEAKDGDGGAEKKKGEAKEKIEGAGGEAPEKPKLGEGEQAPPAGGEEGAGVAGEGAKGAAPKGAGGAPAGGAAGGEGDAGGDAVDVTPFDALLAKKAGGGAAMKKGPAASMGATAGPMEGAAGPAMGENAGAPAAEGAMSEGPAAGPPVGTGAEPEAPGAAAEGDAAMGDASGVEGPTAPEEKEEAKGETGEAKAEKEEPAPEKEPEPAPAPAEPSAPNEPAEGAEASPAEAPAAETPAAEAAPAPEPPAPALQAEGKEETKAGDEAAMGAPPAPAAASEASEPPALPEVGATEATGGGEAESADASTDEGANADAGAGANANANAGASANANADAGADAGAAPEAGANANAGAAPEAGPSADAGAAPEADAGGGEVSGGGGGGGGGSPIEDKPPPAAPDVSASSPSQAMAAMASLPPATLKASLGGVTAATNRAIGDERTDLASNPPQVDRPSGAPATHPPAANVADLASKVPNDPAGKVDAVPPGETLAPPAPPPPPQFAPPPPLPSPVVAGDAKISAENAAQVQAAADNLPTTDPELNVTAGDTPALSLEGDADPQQAKDQRENLDASVTDAQEQGAKDAAQPMGETEVYPDTPAETLKATIPEGGGGAAAGGEGGPAAGAGAGGAAGGGGGGGEVDEETASIVAQEQQGDAIQAQVQGKSSEMEAEKAKKDQDSQKEKSDTQEKIDGAIEDDAKEQKDERDGVQKEVKEQREKWTEGQKDAVAKGNEKADKANADADKEIGKQQKDGQSEAKGHIDDGNKEIGDARKDAEGKAKDERKKAKTETSSGGFFDWLGSKVKSFFDGIKNAIKAAFDAARKLVKAAIKKAQELAAKAIEAARKAIVKAIHVVGDALIAIGDEVLGAFPELRDKYKKFIQDRVQAAEDTVNKLAEGLKKAITEFLDLLGKALDAILGLLEKAYLAAVDAVAKFVDGAIKAAKAVAQALAAFAVLIKDVAAGPGKWIRNLGSAVVDGIRNHLVKAFKRQIKEWFDSTVEQVLGIGKALIAFLKKGGISWSMIGKMAWEALKSAIPGFLIGLLVEKLVAMIVPAAAAVMAIIEGLQAAWGAIQRIIAAFQLFFAFLKAVKGGNAGPQFAEALAAAAIVVIQFVAFWLLKKLIKPASKVGAKLREIAKKIGGALKKAGKAIVKGVKAVGRAVVKGAKAVGRALKKGAQAVGRAIKKVGEKIKNSKIWKKIANSKVGKKLKAAYEKTRAKIKEWKEKAKKKYEDWKKKRTERKEERKKKRIERAERELPPKMSSLLAAKPSRLRVLAQLGLWRVTYGLRSARVSGDESLAFSATINPTIDLGSGWTFKDAHLMRLVKEVAAELVTERAPDPSRKATQVEPSSGLPEKDATKKVSLPGFMDEPAKINLGPGASVEHRATPGSLNFGGSRAVVEAGKEGGLTYPQIRAKLGKENPGPLLEELFTGKPVPGSETLSPEARRATLSLYALMALKEPTHPVGTGRHGRDLVYGAMVTQLLTSPDAGHRIDAPRALDLFPAGADKIQTGTRTVTNKLNKPGFAEFEPARLGRSASERYRREVETLTLWGKMQVERWKLIYKTKPTDEEIKDLIRSALRPLLARFER